VTAVGWFGRRASFVCAYREKGRRKIGASAVVYAVMVGERHDGRRGGGEGNRLRKT